MQAAGFELLSSRRSSLIKATRKASSLLNLVPHPTGNADQIQKVRRFGGIAFGVNSKRLLRMINPWGVFRGGLYAAMTHRGPRFLSVTGCDSFRDDDSPLSRLDYDRENKLDGSSISISGSIMTY